MIEELSTGIASKRVININHTMRLFYRSRRRVNKIQERNQPKQRTIVDIQTIFIKWNKYACK